MRSDKIYHVSLFDEGENEPDVEAVVSASNEEEALERLRKHEMFTYLGKSELGVAKVKESDGPVHLVSFPQQGI